MWKVQWHSVNEQCLKFWALTNSEYCAGLKSSVPFAIQQNVGSEVAPQSFSPCTWDIGSVRNTSIEPGKSCSNHIQKLIPRAVLRSGKISRPRIITNSLTVSYVCLMWEQCSAKLLVKTKDNLKRWRGKSETKKKGGKSKPTEHSRNITET